MEDNMFTKINESLNSTKADNVEFEIKQANKRFFIGEICEKEKLNEDISKYLNVLECF